MRSKDTLPAYLQKYVAEQDYDAYTPQEHATWRAIMRQSRSFFSQHAVDIYLEGLKKTGIPIDRIPRISDMDNCLSEFGWGAVGVRGFIPSSVFLDLLARGIMPIACDMRSIDHIGYTPAPDIVHEAAGHAPIVADPAYREFLESYAQMAYRALISDEDIKLYEAIRYLSDIKENPDTTPAQIEEANKRLDAVSKSMTFVSEAGKVARMAWWTTEYGLVGDINSPKIYGAGLLSSISESQNCLSPKIKKIPLSVDCVNQTYDITEPQPQLFVAENMESLKSVLKDLESTFAFRQGGLSGLEKMKKAATVNTIQFETGVSASGKLEEFIFSDAHGLEFFKLSGESQICFNEKEIADQGRARHSHGYSSPVGRWVQAPSKPASQLTDADLEGLELRVGSTGKITYQSGIVLTGKLKSTVRKNGNLVLMTFQNCTVRRGERIFFEPDWGEFDLILGEQVASVFAGPGDRDAYGDYYVGDASTIPGRTSPHSDAEKATFQVYQKLRQYRQGATSSDELKEVCRSALALEKPDWLALLEIAEVAHQKLQLTPENTPWMKPLWERLMSIRAEKPKDVADIIDRGAKLVRIAD